MTFPREAAIALIQDAELAATGALAIELFVG
jgi:hypothetical protein